MSRRSIITSLLLLSLTVHAGGQFIDFFQGLNTYIQQYQTERPQLRYDITKRTEPKQKQPTKPQFDESIIVFDKEDYIKHKENTTRLVSPYNYSTHTSTVKPMRKTTPTPNNNDRHNNIINNPRAISSINYDTQNNNFGIKTPSTIHETYSKSSSNNNKRIDNNNNDRQNNENKRTITNNNGRNDYNKIQTTSNDYDNTNKRITNNNMRTEDNIYGTSNGRNVNVNFASNNRGTTDNDRRVSNNRGVINMDRGPSNNRGTITNDRGTSNNRGINVNNRDTTDTNRGINDNRGIINNDRGTTNNNWGNNNSQGNRVTSNPRPDLNSFTTANPLLNRPGVMPAPVDVNRPPITNRPDTSFNVFTKPKEPGAITFIEDPSEPEIEIGPDEDDMSSSEKMRYIEIAEQACDEYKSLNVKKVVALPLVPSSQGVEVDVPDCTPLDTPLIIGGKVTRIRDFPHMALVGWTKIQNDGYSWKCGGSLVSEQYALTAGHCTYQDKDYNVVSGPPTVVQLGSSYLNDPGATIVKIMSVIRHPKYKVTWKYYDVALIKLVTTVRFTDVIRPACIGVPPSAGRPVIATGWGRTEFGGDSSLELRSVSFPIWDMQDCKNIWGTSRSLPNGPSSDSQVCAGEKSGGKDTCQGDSGGPAQIQDGCVWRVVAVTSLGRSCGAPDIPALYATVPRAFVAKQVFGDRKLNHRGGNTQQNGYSSGNTQQNGNRSGNTQQNGNSSGNTQQNGNRSGNTQQIGNRSGNTQQNGNRSGNTRQNGYRSVNTQQGDDEGYQYNGYDNIRPSGQVVTNWWTR